MKNYNQFHDGWFEGLWIDGKTAHVFLATYEQERYVMVADGVARLIANGIHAGNIIFDVLERASEEIVLQDIRALYELQADAAGEIWVEKHLQRAHIQEEKISEINPSYGASCLVLAGSLNLLCPEDWLERYGFHSAH